MFKRVSIASMLASCSVLSVRVTVNDGNQNVVWERLTVEEADVPVLITDLSQFSAPIPEEGTRSLTFRPEDSDTDGQVMISHAIHSDDVLKYSGAEEAVSLSHFYAGLEAETAPQLGG
jgi:hypothetical protein